MNTPTSWVFQLPPGFVAGARRVFGMNDDGSLGAELSADEIAALDARRSNESGFYTITDVVDLDDVAVIRIEEP